MYLTTLWAAWWAAGFDPRVRHDRPRRDLPIAVFDQLCLTTLCLTILTPFFLVRQVMMAIKDAVAAARADNGLTGWPPLSRLSPSSLISVHPSSCPASAHQLAVLRSCIFYVCVS